MLIWVAEVSFFLRLILPCKFVRLPALRLTCKFDWLYFPTSIISVNWQNIIPNLRKTRHVSLQICKYISNLKYDFYMNLKKTKRFAVYLFTKPRFIQCSYWFNSQKVNVSGELENFYMVNYTYSHLSTGMRVTEGTEPNWNIHIAASYFSLDFLLFLSK